MSTSVGSLTVEGILASLGYADPLAAARQQARMILLGKLAHYQAAIRQLEAQWNCTLEDLRERYNIRGSEDWEADEAYLEWQWYADAVETINAQLAVISKS